MGVPSELNVCCETVVTVKVRGVIVELQQRFEATLSFEATAMAPTPNQADHRTT